MLCRASFDDKQVIIETKSAKMVMSWNNGGSLETGDRPLQGRRLANQQIHSTSWKNDVRLKGVREKNKPESRFKIIIILWKYKKKCLQFPPSMETPFGSKIRKHEFHCSVWYEFKWYVLVFVGSSYHFIASGLLSYWMGHFHPKHFIALFCKILRNIVPVWNRDDEAFERIFWIERKLHR